MSRISKALLYVLCLCLLPLCGARACDDTACFVSGADVATLVAMRERPDADAPVRCWFYSGMGFTVLNHEEGWLAVCMPGVPGLPELPETFTITGGEELPASGYIAETDACEVGWMDLDSFYNLLPEGTLRRPAGETIALLSAPDANALPQAVLLPGTLLRLLGKANGYYLVSADSVYGYLPEDSIVSTGHSAALPADLLWERPDYYADFPLTFALVNPEFDDGTVPLLAAPSSQAEQLGEYPCGGVVRILEEGLPYCLVQTVDREGYMERALLQVEGETGKRTLVGIRSLCSTLSMDFGLHTFPDANAPMIAQIEATGVEVLGVAGSWYYVSVFGWYSDRGLRYQGFMRPSIDYDTGYWLGDFKSERVYGILTLPENMARAPLYAEPSIDSAVLSRFFNTTQVEILEVVGVPSGIDLEQKDLETLPWCVAANEEGVFLRVRVGELEGFIPYKYVSVVQRANPSTW